MRITVINGTEKHGVTYRLKELFLDGLRQDAEITEFYLPADCPAFCVGCTSCFSRGEETCKDREYVEKIEAALLAADLIVMTTPAYVMHTTGAMKAMLDHLGYMWMPHRPRKEMFLKRAVIISQCLGAGSKSAAKDIKDSLSWWGVSKIYTYSVSLMQDVFWDKLDDGKRESLTEDMAEIAKKVKKINYMKPARTGLMTKLKFAICRMIQNAVKKTNPDSIDVKYWEDNGWLGKARPWKKIK